MRHQASELRAGGITLVRCCRLSLWWLLTLSWVVSTGWETILAMAQQPSHVEQQDARVQEAFERLRTAGFDALYNLDYRQARTAFEELTQLYPTHPAGYLYLTNCMWAEKLYRMRRLQATTYAGTSFFADTKETFDHDFDRRYRDAIGRVLQVADARLQANPRDTVALYYKGAAHGLLGAYEATVTRAFFAALSYTNKSVSLHCEVLKLDPTYIDANLSIGLYNYVVGSLPLPIKIIAALGGIRGSKKHGLALITKVANEGRTARDAARLLLVALYKREKQYAEALSHLEVFTRQYRANHVARLELADTLVRLGRVAESIAIFEQLIEDPSTGTYRDAIEYQLGDALLSVGRIEEAATHLRTVLNLPGANPDLVTLAQLRLGEAHDIAGCRAEAVVAYRAVLQKRNVFDSHARAQANLKKPYALPTSNTLPPAVQTDQDGQL